MYILVKEFPNNGHAAMKSKRCTSGISWKVLEAMNLHVPCTICHEIERRNLNALCVSTHLTELKFVLVVHTDKVWGWWYAKSKANCKD